MGNQAVIAIVNYNGKFLLGRKRSDSNKFLARKWHIPAETVKKEESDEQALIRGIKEETGLEVHVSSYMGRHVNSVTGTEARWYTCVSLTETIVPGSDLEDVMWATKEQVLALCGEMVYYWPDKVKDYFRTN